MNFCGREKGYQNHTKANKGGGASKFWSFYDNVIVECPLLLAVPYHLVVKTIKEAAVHG